MALKRVVVAGGNGFLGTRICKSAVNRGWSVTSLSRSGEPRWDTVTSSHDRPTWAKSVEWAKADLLQPDTYKPFLRDADVVVHSMGILLEADYKGVVRGKEPVISGLQRAFSSSKLGSQNPLTRRDGERLEPKERDGQLTYEIMNRDSESKLPELRSIFIRPPFMYDSSRKFTLPIALGGFVASQLNALLGDRLRFLGAMVDKPFQVDLVGEAVVEAMEDESIRGAVGTKQIENLATKAWRKSML
ncbi:hypothetical protein EMGR_000413 [Emarellia grisea]